MLVLVLKQAKYAFVDAVAGDSRCPIRKCMSVKNRGDSHFVIFTSSRMASSNANSSPCSRYTCGYSLGSTATFTLHAINANGAGRGGRFGRRNHSFRRHCSGLGSGLTRGVHSRLPVHVPLGMSVGNVSTPLVRFLQSTVSDSPCCFALQSYLWL